MSIDDMHDDAEFERFLAGEDDLSLQLKKLPQGEPAPALDAAVLAAVEAAMAAEKVQALEPQSAANDPVGPQPLSPQKKRSMAWYWHWPVGFAAGILLTLAYRNGFQSPEAPKAVALADGPVESKLVESRPEPLPPPPPLAYAPPRVQQGTPPAVEVPAVPSTPSMPAPMPEKPVAEARVADAPAPGDPVATASVTTSAAPPMMALKKAEVPAEADKSADLAKRADRNVSDSLRRAPGADVSGTEMAWTHDPAQDAHATVRARAAREMPAAPAALAAAPAMAATPAPAPAREVAALTPPAYAPAAPAAPAASPFGIAARADARSISPSVDSRTVAVQSAAPAASQPEAKSLVRQAVEADSGQEAQRKLALAEKAHTDPRKWLALIEQKIKDKDNQAALAEWDKFGAAYPAYPVKDALRAAIKDLRAQAEPAKPASDSQADPGPAK